MKVKKYTIIAFLFTIFLGCNNENAPNCFQNAGAIIQEEISLASFSKITVFEGIKLVVKQGAEQKVTLETGEFLRNDITLDVVDGRLLLRNENSCNLVRDFGLTIVYVTAPNITEIRSSTGFPIKSDGVLNYPSLSLLSESFGNPEAETTDGEFDIEINNSNLSIVSNGIAYFNIKGKTQDFNIIIAAGDSRIDAKNLIAENIVLNHRGSNDILINPQQSVKGKITGTGDVISFNTPSIVEVAELYKGKLIFNF
tara:strand:- start:107825 stop:108586 length:762 start_codon:yes stop_codon:yes gene_type:complete